MKTILQIVDRCPPFLCIALAKRGSHAMRLPEISKRSGVSERMLLRLKLKTSWKGVKVNVIDSVMRACGVTLGTINQKIEFIKQTVKSDKPFPHLRRNQYRTLLRRIQQWNSERS